MAQNLVPKRPAARTRQANTQIAGLSEHQAALNLTRVTAASLQMALALYFSERDVTAVLKTAQKTARNAKNAAVAAQIVYVGKIRRHFQDVLGTTHNALWLEAGFPAGSTAVPQNWEDLVTILGRIAAFLGTHPEHQLAVKNITPMDAQTAAASLTAAHDAFRDAVTAYNSGKHAATQAYKALGKMMGNSIIELHLVLQDDDEIWYDFGLRRPIDPETPLAPTGLHLSGAGTGRVFADWDDVLGAAHYHVLVQKPADTEPHRFTTAADSEKALQGLPSGQTIKVWVRALNKAGHSPLSAMVEILVP